MLTRRQMLEVGLATLATGGKYPIVLVHGAWHGGWVWSRVAEKLRAQGHNVFAPTLTGLAERKAELTEKVTLGTHIADVCALIEKEPLSNVVLVGHSYAGLVITGVAARVAPKLRRVIYLDAFVPEPGQKGFDLMKPKFAEHWRERAQKEGDGFKVPPMLNAKAMGVDDAKDQKWVDGQLTPQPIGTMDEPLEFDAAAFAKVPKAYVRCGKFGGFGPTSKKLAAAGWTVKNIDAGHDAMVTHPSEVAAVVHELTN